MDSLHAPVFVVAKQCGNLGGAPQLGNQFRVGHAAITHRVYAAVNAPCINTSFTSGTIGAMHPSMSRLLDHARRVTGRADLDWPSIGSKLGASSATLTNWKDRGISMKGAIDAEMVYGCSPLWLLTGKSAAKAPPESPDFNERKPTDSQWAVLQAIAVMPEEPKRELLRQIEEEGKKWQLISDELLGRVKRGS